MRRQAQKQIAFTSFTTAGFTTAGFTTAGFTTAGFTTNGFVCSVERAGITGNQGVPSFFQPMQPEFTNRGACL